MSVVQAIILALTPDIPFIRNTGQFSDVPKGHPAEAYLLYAERLGIITADIQTRLYPMNQVTRAEFLVMTARAWALPTGTFYTYTDVPAGSWFAPYAGLAAEYRLFDTEVSDVLQPEKPVTINEVNRALLLVKTIKSVNGELRIDGGSVTKDPRIYTVISSRRNRVPLVAPSSQPARTPLVRRTRIPLSVAQQRTTVLSLINEIRRDHRLPELQLDERLQQSAQLYANRMAEENFFSHVSPDGKTIRERMAATGFYDRTFQKDCGCVKGYSLGENLAKGQKTPQEAVDDWMKSDDHRAAILNPAYNLSGVGVNAGIWVQHFGGVTIPGQ
jgi:uncharacterized protein YkwD